MKRPNPWCFSRTAVFVFLAVTGSCTALPYLRVVYRLPAKTDAWASRPVSFTVLDERPDKTILGAGAQNELGGSSSVLSLAVARGEGREVEIGIFDLSPFFREAFKKRLEYAGIQLSTDGKTGQLELRVAIQEFNLDLVDRKWLFRMGYEARLGKDGNVLSMQKFRGNAERLKIFGRDQAEQLVGEVFTDMLNQMDVSRLFQQAGL
jgi:hypothetical protein